MNNLVHICLIFNSIILKWGFYFFTRIRRREVVSQTSGPFGIGFGSVCAKVQIDKWVSDMNKLFPNCPYYHITFTVPSECRTLLFEKKDLLDAVFSAATETLISFCKEQGFLPAITAVMHTLGCALLLCD